MIAEEGLLGIVRFHHGFSTQADVQLDMWPSVIQLALRHRVLSCLLSAKGLGLSDAAVDSVRDVALHHAQWQLLARAKLETLTQHLREAKVDFLIFKGISLQDPFYRGCRRMWGDIDLICRPRDLAALYKVLVFNGYRHKTSPALCTHGATFADRSGVEVDAHTCFVEPYISDSPNLEGVFARRRPIPSLGCDTLDHIDHLLVLLLHGFKHHWCRLQWILDVALVMRTLGPNDFDLLEQRAAEIRALSVVHVGLMLASNLFSLSINSHNAAYREGAAVDSLCSVYNARLFQEIPDTPWIKGQNSLLHLRALEGIYPRLRYVVGRAQNMLGISRLRAERWHASEVTSVEQTEIRKGSKVRG